MIYEPAYFKQVFLHKLRNHLTARHLYKNQTFMKKTLLLLLITFSAYAQPNIGAPQNLETCDNNIDGVAQFDLTVNTPIVLNGLNPQDYIVSYYETN